MDSVGKMHFGEFNPLDVLAAAAVLQSAQLPDAEPENNGDADNTCQEVDATDEDDTADDADIRSSDTHVAVTLDVATELVTVNDNDVSNNNCVEFGVSSKLHVVSVLSDNAGDMGRKQSAINVIHVVDGRGDTGDTIAAASDVNSAVTLQVDGGKRLLTTTPLKAVALQTNIGRFARMITDHSYTFLHRHMDASRTKTDEDEGYCSRSSLDSPGQGSRSDSDACDQDVFDQRDGENKDMMSCRIISRQNSNKRDTSVVLMSPPGVGRSPGEAGQVLGDSSNPMPVVMVINGCKVIQDPKRSTGCDGLSEALGKTAGNLFGGDSLDDEGMCSTEVNCGNPVTLDGGSSVEPTQDGSRCMEDTNTTVGPGQELPCVTTPSVQETTAVKDAGQFDADSKKEQPREVDMVGAHKTADCQAESGCKQKSSEQEENDCIMLQNNVCAEFGVDVRQFSVVESMDCSVDKNADFPAASVDLEPHIESSMDVRLPSDALGVGDNDSATGIDSMNATDVDSDRQVTGSVMDLLGPGNSPCCVDDVESLAKIQSSVNTGEAIDRNETTVVETDCDCTDGAKEEGSTPVTSEKLFVVPRNGCSVELINCDEKSDSQETDKLSEENAQDEETLVVDENESTESVAVPVIQKAESISEAVTGSKVTVCGDGLTVTEAAAESGCGDTSSVMEKDTESACGDTSVVTDSGSKVPLPVNDVKFGDISGVNVKEPVITQVCDEPMSVTTGQTECDDAATSRTPGCDKTPTGTVASLGTVTSSGFQVTHKSGHQYIIEDDVSPVTKFGLSAPLMTEYDSLVVSPSTKSQQDCTPRGNDAWKLVGTYNQKGEFVSNSHTASTEQKDVDVCSINSQMTQSECDATDRCKNSDFITSGLSEFCGDQRDSTTAQDQTDTSDAISADDVLSLGKTSQSEFESLVLQTISDVMPTISDVMPSLQSGCKTDDAAIPKINNCDDIDTAAEPTSLFGSVICGLQDGDSDRSRNTTLSAESSNIGHVLDQCSPLRMSTEPRNDSNDREVATLTLADGRITPVHQSPSLGLRGLEMSPCEQINIKIAGGKVVGMNLLDEGPARKATTSIGTVGSLQWTSLPQMVSKRGRPTTKSPYSINSGSFIPIPDNRPSVATLTGGQTPTQVDLYEGQALTTRVLLDGACKTSPPQCKTLLSARTCHMYMRKKLKQQSDAASKNLGVDLSRVKQSAETILQLHPLIDHDYCMFTEFSADIQSSIIATTESKLKTDKKYTKKTKAARTTKSEPFITPTPVERVPVVKLKKRKYVRRKGIVAVNNNVTAEEKKLKRVELVRMREAMSDNSVPTVSEFNVKSRDEKKLAKAKMLTRRRSDRNYVKITGSYQDEFVYFATKKTRGRPRKTIDANDASQAKLPPISGVSVFDWYRDLSKTDKSSRFGMLDTAVDEGRPSIPSVSPTAITSSTSCSSAGHTPIHESEVVDLVMDLMPSTSLGNYKLFMNSYNQTPKVDLDDSTTSSSGVDGGKSVQPAEDELVELNLMAEQVRMMLNSMGEAELKMWEEKLSDSNGDKSSSFPDVAVPQGETPTSASTNLLDLDDINDNDLLSTDIGNMTVILGDLTAPKPAGLSIASGSGSTDLPAVKSDVAPDTYSFDKNTATLNMLFNDPVSIDQSNGFGPDLEVNKTQSEYTVSSTAVGLNGLFGEPKLDRYELFPDIATSDVALSSAMSVSQSSAPELTVVSMFWNDLPGLTIRNKKYVRLVDIHKQILPAKDTGILKKRCQMMGLEVANCSELERDFLIRYANAVKSKSTVIIPQDAAQQLIGFYVNPRPRMSRFSGSDDHGFEQTEKCRKSEVTSTPQSITNFTEAADGESEPVTENDTMHDLPEKATLSQLVDTNGRIRQIIIGRRKYGRSASRRKRKASTSSDTNKPKRQRVGVANAAQSSLTLKAANKASTCVNAVKRSTRMKYEKGHYAAMLQGLCRKDTAGVKEESVEKNTVSLTRDSETRSGDIDMTPVTLRPCKMARWSAFHVGRLSSGKKLVEELELCKMRTLQKKRRLTSVEKLRMKKLRERLRKKMIIQEPLRRGRKQKLVAGMIAVAAAAAGKRQRKLALKSKKLNGAGVEHCYAAAVETPQSGGQTENFEANQTQLDVNEQTLQVVHCAPGGDPRNCQVGTLRLTAYTVQESVCIECNMCGRLLSVVDFLRHQHPTDVVDTQQLLAVSEPHTLRLHSATPSPRVTSLWNEFQNRRQTFDGTAVKHIIDLDASVQPDKTATQSMLVATPVTEFDASTTRHSKRVRKRKQLHPIERYVFSKLYATNEDEDAEDGDDSSLEVVPQGEEQSAAVATHVVSGRTKPKLTQRRDSKAETKQQKYGLRTSPEEARKRRRL